MGEDDDRDAADALVGSGPDGGEDLVASDPGELEVEQDEVPLGQAAAVEVREGGLAVGVDLQDGVGQALAEGDAHQLGSALGVLDQQDSPRAVTRGQELLRVRRRASTIRLIDLG